MSSPSPSPSSSYALSGIFIVNLRGEVLISRAYRDHLDKHVFDAFRLEILNPKTSRGAARSYANASSSSQRKMDAENAMIEAPVRRVGSLTYAFKRHRDVYVVGVSRERGDGVGMNQVIGFTFLCHVVRLTTQYFGSCDENAIRGNFVLMYELLDEICDNGYPQITAGETLKTFITQRDKSRELMTKDEQHRAAMREQQMAVEAARQMTSAVQWRKPGITYKKNEVFLDIVESVTVMMSAEGTVLRSAVQGGIYMRTQLSGMPILTVGLNDRLAVESRLMAQGEQPHASAAASRKLIELDDLQFHQSVRLHKFTHEKTIEFTPPDGEFELARYRVSDNVTLPFKLMPAVKELGRTRIAVTVNIKSLYSEKTVANEVRVRIPVPKHTARAVINVTGGKAKYVPEEGCLRWKLKRVAGHEEFQLDAEVTLSSTLSEHKAWVQPPINVLFQLPMFTASGLRVRFLEVKGESGQPYPDVTRWIRYLCTSGSGDRGGSYEIRCA
jgi:AP-2 complex subunit mu-1